MTGTKKKGQTKDRETNNNNTSGQKGGQTSQSENQNATNWESGYENMEDEDETTGMGGTTL